MREREAICEGEMVVEVFCEVMMRALLLSDSMRPLRVRPSLRVRTGMW